MQWGAHTQHLLVGALHEESPSSSTSAPQGGGGGAPSLEMKKLRLRELTRSLPMVMHLNGQLNLRELKAMNASHHAACWKGRLGPSLVTAFQQAPQCLLDILQSKEPLLRMMLISCYMVLLPQSLGQNPRPPQLFAG